MERKLKEGDTVRMKADTPDYRHQGIHGDGSPAIGTIYKVDRRKSHYYGVNWDNGKTRLTYDDRHIELYVKLPEVINNYQIY